MNHPAHPAPPASSLYKRGFHTGFRSITCTRSRVILTLHPSGSNTPPQVLSLTPTHATWSGLWIIHAVALVA